MLAWIMETPESLRRHWRRSQNTPGWSLESWPQGVAVLGMGGSGMAGMLLQGILCEVSPAPVLWLTDHHLPRWLGPSGLAIACSYSGDTWEVLRQLDEVRERGIPWMGISSGGELRERAGRDGAPWMELDGGRAPRAMSLAALLCLISIFSRLEGKLASWTEETTAGMAADIAEWSRPEGETVSAGESREAWPRLPRRPETLARFLARRLPLLYGTGFVGEVVAYRWQCQLAENGKKASHAHRLTELLHNEIVAWKDWTRYRPAPLALHIVTETEESLSDAGWDRMWRELRRTGLKAARVPAEGGSLMERSMRQILLGDAVSAFVASERGVETTPVAPIDRLKGKLPFD